MRIEQMLSFRLGSENGDKDRDGEDSEKTQDHLTQIMVKLAQYERDGLIARFPDGRYGPARV